MHSMSTLVLRLRPPLNGAPLQRRPPVEDLAEAAPQALQLRLLRQPRSLQAFGTLLLRHAEPRPRHTQQCATRAPLRHGQVPLPLRQPGPERRQRDAD